MPVSNTQSCLVSVIIPIYNSEIYLSDMINSILNQSLYNIEIICIDDGSTDNSADIIKQYAEKDVRVKYYWQENKGAGSARNKGISIASGKYLSFLDADDLYDPYMLEAMSNALEESGAEICICKVERFDNQTGKSVPFSSLPHNCENGLYVTNDLQGVLFQTMLAPWNKLFLRSFIEENNLQYQNLIWTNDVYFVGSALALSTGIFVINKVYVYYRYNVGNSLQDKKNEYPLCGMEAWLTLRKCLMERDILTINGRRSLDEACFDSLFNYFKKFVNDEVAARSIYEQLKYKLICDIRSNEDPSNYLPFRKRLKLWCVERTSLKGLRWAAQPLGNGKRYYNKFSFIWTNMRLIIAGIIYKEKKKA